MAVTNELWTARIRRSPAFRALAVLPTPARPWVLAFEALTSLQLANQARHYQRREATLEKQLTRAQRRAAEQELAVEKTERREKAAKAKGPGALGTLVLGAGLAYLATQLLSKDKSGFSISGFVNDSFDQVQTVVDDTFEKAHRALVGSEK